jgi:hypothetical protein
MSSSEQKGARWKEKIFREFGEYATIVIYLSLVFAAFTQYRRLVLAAHDISYTNYWIALVEAFILGKVIMIGSVLRIGRRLENMPLIFPALYKTVMFTLLVVVFTLCEHGLKGLWTGKGFGSGLLEFLGRGAHELLAGSFGHLCGPDSLLCHQGAWAGRGYGQDMGSIFPGTTSPMNV